MASTITLHSGEVKPVKNLGWILRNWKSVEYIDVVRHRNPAKYAFVTFYLRNGRVAWYSTDYASKTVLADWLNRPVFRGLPVCWFGTNTTIGE